jgi:hypothetical protein
MRMVGEDRSAGEAVCRMVGVETIEGARIRSSFAACTGLRGDPRARRFDRTPDHRP